MATLATAVLEPGRIERSKQMAINFSARPSLLSHIKSPKEVMLNQLSAP
jgi:hypothetical protein